MDITAGRRLDNDWTHSARRLKKEQLKDRIVSIIGSAGWGTRADRLRAIGVEVSKANRKKKRTKF
jgi:hypothetical protein